MKRLVVLCDGTWATLEQASPTNVAKLSRAVGRTGTDGVEQIPRYERGVGTSMRDRIRGGAFGFGLSSHVKDCYRFLVDAFEPGDELYLMGFSRGAYTARSTAGLVRNSGILRREHAGRVDEAYELYRHREKAPASVEATAFRRAHSHETRIHFIGVWDTVGALGIPLNGLRFVNVFNRRWQFHDTRLSTTVDRAYQALAIDERRGPFVPTMWDQQPDAGEQVLEQVWFAGDHSDVGGGYAEAALADIALLWIADRAAAAGLGFEPEAFSARHVDPRVDGRLHDARTGLFRLIRPHVRRPGRETIPNEDRIGDRQSIASSARDRLGRAGYRPPPGLGDFLRAGGLVTTVRTTAGPPPA